MPEFNDAHQRLAKLAGSWSGVETFPAKDGEEARSTITAAMELGGFFLILDYTQTRDGRESFRGHGVCGWDPAKGRYLLHWFDTTDFLPAAPALGDWEGGEQLTFHAKSPDGRHRRYVCHFSEAAQCSFRIDETSDGVSWKSLLTAELRRGR